MQDNLSVNQIAVLLHLLDGSKRLSELQASIPSRWMEVIVQSLQRRKLVRQNSRPKVKDYRVSLTTIGRRVALRHYQHHHQSIPSAALVQPFSTGRHLYVGAWRDSEQDIVRRISFYAQDDHDAILAAWNTPQDDRYFLVQVTDQTGRSIWRRGRIQSRRVSHV
jgi:hypothetical protein